LLHARQRLGDFEVIRLLGRGGMGEVYEAQQGHPSRRVALKVLADDLVTHPDAVERFHREADALARLRHPGIVRIFTTGRTPTGTVYFAMELVQGVSLARLLRDAVTPPPVPGAVGDPGGPDAPTVTEPGGADGADDPVRCYRKDRFRFVVRAGVALADALAAAHAEQVLHRDLKPGNVMADRHGRLYLLDFGLARLGDDAATNATSLKGTPLYMAPEQAWGKPTDARSDVFSLGVLLYELATGGVGPYAVPRQDRDAVLAEARAGRLRPLRDVFPGVPAVLVTVINKAVAFRPEDRYQTAAEMLADLKRIDAEPARPEPPPARPAGRGKVFLRCLVGAGLALVAVAAAALWLPLKEQPWFPWPDNRLPPSRQIRKPGDPIPLFQRGGLPVWSQVLCGDPQPFQAMKDNASVLHNFNGMQTFALLDYAPSGWFLFDIKMRQATDSPEGECVPGIFLGYRRFRDAPEKHAPVLGLRLEETPGGVSGGPRLEVGWCLVEEATAQRKALQKVFQPLPDARREIALGPHQNRDRWRTVAVQVLDGRVTVRVDNRKPVEFSFEELRKAVPGLDPRGGVGIWAERGVGSFTAATLTPLASEAIEP